MAEVVKGGVTWLEMTLKRGGRGLEMWVKGQPEIEEFFKGLSRGRTQPMSLYGRDWFHPDDSKDIRVYDLDESRVTVGTGYLLNKVAESLEDGRTNKVNLSFLRFEGISSPEGIKFIVAGPYSKDYSTTIADKLIKQSSQMIKDFIVPVHISLRITSQDI